MRLAQLARKVNTKPAEIREFIKDEFKVDLDNDPNVKIDDDHAKAVLDKYQQIEEPKAEKAKVEEAKATEASKEEEVIDPDVDTDIDTLKEIAEAAVSEDNPSVEETKEEPKIDDSSEEEEKKSKKEKVVKIQYEDPETESDDSNEGKKEDVNETEEEPKVAAVDPDAELIAGEVEKLEGLKVVGKIDLIDNKTKKLMEEEVELPAADKIEEEIEALDQDIDTSEFPTIAEETENDEEKEALFAELDKQMEAKQGKVKKVSNDAKEIKENIDEEEEEYSIYKNKKGEYRFTLEQKKNREKSLFDKKVRERKEREKEKKRRHYEENIAPKVKKKNKKVKKQKKKAEAKAEEKVKGKKQEPKGIWQRFLNWLND